MTKKEGKKWDVQENRKGGAVEERVNPDECPDRRDK